MDHLVDLVKQGDDAAARQLVGDLYGQVISIVRKHLPHQRHDEEDLAQDIFLKMFTRIHQYQGQQPFPHWVSRIAVNTCLDRLRAQKVRPVRTFTDLNFDPTLFHDTVSWSDDGEERQNAPGEFSSELVEKLLATLKPEEQIILRMLDLEQKSVSEISELTGWGASKIKVTAMRSRRKLTATLQKLESTAAV